jgi:Immunoglobulin I-set domain
MAAGHSMFSFGSFSAGELFIQHVSAENIKRLGTERHLRAFSLISFNCSSLSPVPLITISPEYKKVETGTNVALLCDAEGNPEPSFFWSKDEHTVKFTNRIYLATDNKTLNIDHIKESDAGLYACIAENILGSDEATAQVDVINAHGPPNLIFEPFDLEAIPGTTIELPCGAEGNPPPLVNSTHNFSSKQKLEFFSLLLHSPSGRKTDER